MLLRHFHHCKVEINIYWVKRKQNDETALKEQEGRERRRATSVEDKVSQFRVMTTKPRERWIRLFSFIQFAECCLMALMSVEPASKASFT